jgi:hypothetical protein
MKIITEIFKQVSASLLVLSYTGNEISKILHILSEFSKNASPDYFQDVEEPHKKNAFKKIPLFFSDKGETAIKGKLAEFPHVIDVAKAGYKNSPLNFLYLVGQFISAIAIKLDYLEVAHKDLFEKQKKEIESLFKIWGSEDKMNARSLFNRFQSIDNEPALKNLENKLSATALIIDKLEIKE